MTKPSCWVGLSSKEASGPLACAESCQALALLAPWLNFIVQYRLIGLQKATFLVKPLYGSTTPR